MTRYTAQEIANTIGVSKEAANGLIQYMKLAGLAQYKGERQNEARRGKGAYVYEISPGASTLIASAVKKIES